MRQIVSASTPEHYDAARRLILAYQAWLGMDLEFQGFDEELESLSVVYGPPRGAMLLADLDGQWVGCVGLRMLEADICEMKRMFVLPEHQGRGIGRDLMSRFLTAAAALGYRAIRLDTVPRLDRAMKLYQSFGFTRIEPYRFNPDPDAIFLERLV